MQLDSSYNKRHVISPVGNISDCLHDFTVTSRDSALISAHYKRRANLSSIGGPADAWIRDGMFQEIDIVTGELLYEWRAAEHVPIANTLEIIGKGTENNPFDYFHINSVHQGPSGDYVVSAGNMRSVLCIDGSTGRIRWSLGGRANSFRDLGEGSTVKFSWPHDARWVGNDTLTVMDSGKRSLFRSSAIENRGMSIYVDSHTRQASVQQVYINPMGLAKQSEGDLRLSQNTGNVFVNWGKDTGFSKFSATGDALCSFYFSETRSRFVERLGLSGVSKHPWIGKPMSKPIAKVLGRRLRVHWNGATEVTEWQLQVKTHSPTNTDILLYHDIGRYKKTGYETSLKIPRLKGSHQTFRVAALDFESEILGYTDDVKWEQAWTGSDLSQSQFRILAGVCMVGGLLTVFSTIHIRLKHQDKVCL